LSYFIHRPIAIYSHEHSALSVILDKRSGLFFIYAETVPYRIRFIVVPLVQLRAINVANPALVRGFVLKMVNVTLLAANTATRHALYKPLDRNLYVHCRADASASHILQRLRLSGRARKAVKNRSRYSVGLGQSFCYHLDRDFIRYEFALGEILLRFPSNRRPVLQILPE
jgi:hypothetical protein